MKRGMYKNSIFRLQIIHRKFRRFLAFIRGIKLNPIGIIRRFLLAFAEGICANEHKVGSHAIADARTPPGSEGSNGSDA